MKALFKYTFRAGLSGRYIAFAVILVMNLAFIIPGMFGLLPLAAQITAVSLSGTAIGVMSVFNIIGDISIIRSMFSAPGAVLYALTPVPRQNRLLVSTVTMFLIDLVTMTVSIVSVVILAVLLGNNYIDVSVWEMLREYGSFNPVSVIVPIFLGIAYYLFIMMLIMFCIAMRKSVFYGKSAGGFLAVLLGFGITYLSSLSALLLAPFADVSFFYGLFSVTFGYLGTGLYALLLFLFATAMFVLTSRLMERKMNI